MNKLDVYYRALRAYRNETNGAATKEDRAVLRNLNLDLDHFVTTKYLCEINEDWIEAIEKGIPFIEKAIAEERQFIRVDGEIIPIEKVKKVSRNSVEHLAKHSDLITKLPEEGKDIIPEKLYITEKLTDYAVYENRFLYMMLDYLDKFITIRLNAIEKLHTLYLEELSFKKEFVDKSREFTFEIKFNDKMLNNPYSLVDDKCLRVIERIKNCQQIVTSFLRGFLMTEVSKSPMIKPPVTKTNVLKMNNNFKNALALYEYISSYKGEGYEVKEIKKERMPFQDDLADELLDVSRLMMFLAYMHGNEIKKELEESFKNEELRRKEEEERKLQERLERMKKHARESNKTLEEYMLLLEQRNISLLKDSEELVRVRNQIFLLEKEIDELNKKINSLKDEINHLNEVIEEKLREIAYLNQKYIDDMAALKKAHAEEIERINLAHIEEIEALKENHANELADLTSRYETELEDLKNQYEIELSTTKATYEDEIESIHNDYKKDIELINERHDAQISEINQNYEQTIDLKVKEHIGEVQSLIKNYENQLEKLNNESTTKISSLENDLSKKKEDLALLTNQKNEMQHDYEARLKNTVANYEKTLKENDDKSNSIINELTDNNEEITKLRNFYKAELDAKRILDGSLVPSEAYTTRERFVELEDEFKAFYDFFNVQWQMTKKAIKKDILNKDIEKRRKEREEEAKLFESGADLSKEFNPDNQISQNNDAPSNILDNESPDSICQEIPNNENSSSDIEEKE